MQGIYKRRELAPYDLEILIWGWLPYKDGVFLKTIFPNWFLGLTIDNIPTNDKNAITNIQTKMFLTWTTAAAVPRLSWEVLSLSNFLNPSGSIDRFSTYLKSAYLS